MEQLKCPNCGSVFTVEESEFQALLAQVRNSEFEKELTKRIAAAMEVERANQALEAQRAKIQADNELRTLRENATNAYREKERELNELKTKLQGLEALKDAEKKSAVLEEQNKLQKELSNRDTEIAQLKADAQLEREKANNREAELRQQMKEQQELANEQIALYKDMKMRLSTKMVGEDLEQHCNYIFETQLRPFFPHAEFHKDNDASSGSKGDFIFRNFDENGTEIVSIMFEMKNESDTTATKHRNDHFYKELDKDRNEKRCEYAILVSMLEKDSEMFNTGIVDVSHVYPKMFVIRPQFFAQIIALLNNTSMKALEYKRELEIKLQQEIDVTHFEENVHEFERLFGDHCRIAKNKFEDAIAAIDKSIKQLEAVKAALNGSSDHLTKAEKNIADRLDIRALTKGNPTMAAKFEAARNASSASRTVTED